MDDNRNFVRRARWNGFGPYLQADAVVWAGHGKPLLFSKGTKGLRLNGEKARFEIVDVEGGDWQAAGVLVGDNPNGTILL